MRDVEVEAFVGLHPWERHPERPTRLIVNVEMFGVAGSLIDYDRVRAWLRTWRDRPHTDLLETLAEEGVRFCLEDEAVRACRFRIEKPDIFNEVAAAGIELFRARPDRG